MPRILPLIVAGLLLAIPATSAARTPPGPAAAPAVLTAEQWRADVDLLVQRIEAMHPAPFKAEGRAAFDARLTVLRQGLSAMSREEAVVGVMQLMASLRDGHSGVPAEFLLSQGFKVLPLRFYVQDGELYLVGADRRYSDALGGRLVSVAGVPAQEVYRRLLTVAPHDNDSSADARLPAYLAIPEVLQGLKIVGSTGPVAMEFQQSGGRVRLSVAPITPEPYNSVNRLELAYTADWVNAGAEARPLWLRHQDSAYWFEFLPESNTLFVQYNQATSDPQEPMPAFARRLRAEIAARKPDRLVLDLRINAGGEGFWNKPLFLAILKADEIDQRGRLFVLIGRRTFSAGSALALDLMHFSKATFIGEPTGGSPQSYGNHERVVLPNSGLPVMIATVFYQNGDPFDQRSWLPPQLAAPVTPADYVAGRDPALAAALAYQAPGEQLRAAVLAAPAGDASAVVARFRADPLYRYLDAEPVLVATGYELIRAPDLPRAVALFEAAAAAYPASANVFDSLGDAYKAAGRRDDAIAAYQKALKINPGWGPSRASLQALGVTPPPGGH